MAVQSKVAFLGFLLVDVPCDLVLASGVYTDMADELSSSPFFLLLNGMTTQCLELVEPHGMMS